jgi:hypothetical protein
VCRIVISTFTVALARIPRRSKVLTEVKKLESKNTPHGQRPTLWARVVIKNPDRQAGPRRRTQDIAGMNAQFTHANTHTHTDAANMRQHDADATVCCSTSGVMAFLRLFELLRCFKEKEAGSEAASASTRLASYITLPPSLGGYCLAPYPVLPRPVPCRLGSPSPYTPPPVRTMPRELSGRNAQSGLAARLDGFSARPSLPHGSWTQGAHAVRLHGRTKGA